MARASTSSQITLTVRGDGLEGPSHETPQPVKSGLREKNGPAGDAYGAWRLPTGGLRNVGRGKPVASAVWFPPGHAELMPRPDCPSTALRLCCGSTRRGTIRTSSGASMPTRTAWPFKRRMVIVMFWPIWICSRILRVKTSIATLLCSAVFHQGPYASTVKSDAR